MWSATLSAINAAGELRNISGSHAVVLPTPASSEDQ
eukprot:CAMPEP_0185353904 /NCGR_PEP_ID=MMETSP1364-20130426/4867_1 /TAXON_ID=38817 /ORGANISM="Gephyrocapsa oceanica, Strain RCC1303" /LENGTH=35 /DNA_ID= /DNA_START= /DNA_END= /DNA_ORIENTATION=